MYKYGLLVTLVVLTCLHYIYAEINNTSETTAKNSTNRTAFIELNFWDKDNRFKTTQSFNMSLRKTPARKYLGLALENYVMEAFLNSIDTNKTVFRYSEVKQYNTKFVRDRAMKNLSALMDLVLVSNQSKNDHQSTDKNSADVTPNITDARRTTFERLFVWSRDPVFEVTTRAPSSLFRRKISNGLKKYGHRHSKHQDHADMRHRANAARRMAMSLTYNRRMLKNKKHHHKHGQKHRPKEPEEIESRKSPMVNNAIAPLNMNATNSSTQLLRTKTEEVKQKRKENIPLSPYSILQQINEILVPELVAMGANISVEVLGRTLEYNDIVMIKAAGTGAGKSFRSNDKFDDVAPEKRIVLIINGLSVMGYNSLPCLKTVDGLTTLMSFYYKHLDKFDIFVIPMANPDGVSAAVAKVYWNKNVSPQSACPGVALDRNFDVAWNQTLCGVSSCSQQFPGMEPFSEPETQVVRDVFHKYSHRIIAYFHVHSSSYSPDIFKGDGVLYPKGFSDIAVDDDRYVDIRGEIDEMMKNASFKVYSVAMETLNQWYGKVSGTSVDFANSVYGVPFAMEFAMQLYQDDQMVDVSKERETSTVLQEVWSRVIDVIFEYMYKNTKTTESQ